MTPSEPGVLSVDPLLREWAAGSLPASTRKIIVERLSTDFRAATRLVSEPLPSSPPPGHVLIRRTYVGINASDINFSAGRYHGSRAAAERQLPFAAGFESVGVVARLGAGVSGRVRGWPRLSKSLPEKHLPQRSSRLPSFNKKNETQTQAFKSGRRWGP